MTTKILFVLFFLLLVQACDSQSPLDELSDEIEQLGDDDGEEDNSDGDDDTSGDSAFENEMLRAINEARSNGRSCGSDFYDAVPPLSLNDQLNAAARSHTQDMATHDYLGHQDSNGDWPWDRVQETGYQASATGENVAAGYRTIETVMTGWLESPGHCANIMNGTYQEAGVARMERTNTQYGVYWTQLFASPR